MYYQLLCAIYGDKFSFYFLIYLYLSFFSRLVLTCHSPFGSCIPYPLISLISLISTSSGASSIVSSSGTNRMPSAVKTFKNCLISILFYLCFHLFEFFQNPISSIQPTTFYKW